MRAESTTMSATQPRSVQPGDVFDRRYEIVRLIAEGGMGSVYLGTQLELDRKVAIKTLNPRIGKDDLLFERLRREALIVRRLTHPNTVRLYDVGVSRSGLLYLVMEYLEGRPLNEVLQSAGRLPYDFVVDIGRQVLKSLVEAHAWGIVHRDVKPSNVMLCEQLGESNLVKVLDFGLACSDIDTTTFQTHSGTTIGTPHYMSPEQLRGERVDCRSDLYAVGLTLFELATGAPPYTGKNHYAVAMKHLSERRFPLPPRLAETRLGKVIRRATEKDPEDRYQSAGQMLEDLTGEVYEHREPVLDTLVDGSVKPGTLPYPMPAPDADNERLGTNVVDVDELRRLDAERPLRSASSFFAHPPRRWVGLVVSLGMAAFAIAWLVTLLWPRAQSPPSGSAGQRVEAAPSAPQPSSTGASGASLTAATGVAAQLGQGNDEAGAGVTDAAPAEVLLRVESWPPQAEVTLEGAYVCTTPCNTRVAARPGPARLTLSLPGFESVVRTEDLSDDVLLPVLLRPASDEALRAETETDDEAPAAAAEVPTAAEPTPLAGPPAGTTPRVDDTRDRSSGLGESASDPPTSRDSVVPTNF
jgi:serine/threonine protein kinase